MEDVGVHGIQKMLVNSYDWSWTGEDAIEELWIALSGAEGRSLVWDENKPAREEDRKEFLKGVARTVLDMMFVRDRGMYKQPQSRQPRGQHHGVYYAISTYKLLYSRRLHRRKDEDSPVSCHARLPS